jgi:hypothetical protein
MAGRPSFDEGGIWALLADPVGAALPENSDAVIGAARAFGALVSIPCAAYLLAPVEKRLGVALFEPDLARRAALYNRFQYRVQLGCAKTLTEAGFDCVYLKGFAHAHTLYSDPVARISGDMDVLVRPRDMARVIASLGDRGFRFRPIPGVVHVLGPTTGLAPFVSADGACNLDLHGSADRYPMDGVLDAETVFAASRVVEAQGVSIRVPSAEHMLAICVSNAAKDKFSAYAVKKFVDAIRLLSAKRQLDWRALEAVFRTARMVRPARAFFGALEALGMSTGAPSSLTRPFSGMAGAEFRAMVADMRALYPEAPGVWAKLRREWLLAAEPEVALRLSMQRLAGRFEAGDGVPQIAAGGAKG